MTQNDGRGAIADYDKEKQGPQVPSDLELDKLGIPEDIIDEGPIDQNPRNEPDALTALIDAVVENVPDEQPVPPPSEG